MSRKSIYLASQKKSEYRRNFLPFDYYDFCITAKENENLRCRNKLRDYLHTPFDWDEDLDIYIEPVSDNNLNQSSQTQPSQGNGKQSKKVIVPRPSQERQEADEYARLVKDYEDELSAQQKKAKKTKKKSNKKKAAQNVKIEADVELEDDFSRNGVHVVAQSGHHSKRSEPQTHRPTVKRTQSSFVKPFGIKNASPAFFKEIQDKKVGNFELLKNSQNMAVQTPPDWTLRERKSKVQANKGLVRSASAVSRQPSRQGTPELKHPPFAMYGSAVRTKDMSFKPTHNALANKTLAYKKHDREAMLEIALQRLQREAKTMANEYSIVESEAANKHRNERSESRGWNSEYEERYPDHSRSASRNELYYKENPYRLNKSTLIADYPTVKRGSASKKKIYFYE